MINALVTYAPHYTSGWKLLSRGWKESSQSGFSAKLISVCKRSVALTGAAVYAAATPLLLSLDLSYAFFDSFREKKLDGNCHLFFKSDLFEAYRSQVKKLVNAHIKEPTSKPQRRLKALVNKKRGSMSLKKRREWYSSFSKALRALQGQERELKLVQDLYFAIELVDPMGALFAKILGNEEASKEEEISELLSKRFKNEGNQPGLFDAHCFGNAPFRLGELPIGKEGKLQLIRMPSITRDLKKNLLEETKEAKIIEEFELFLKALKLPGQGPKKHLYVNLMARKFGNEEIRSQTIEELDRDPEKPIAVISLDKNSDFYKQCGEAYQVEKLQKSAFMQDFFRQMTREEGYFYFPKEITKAHLAALLQEVSLLEPFKGLKEFDQKQRGLFIEHVYVRIIEKAAELLEATSMNVSCANCIDRGVTELYMLFDYLEEKYGTKPLTERQMKAFLFTPALIVAHRPVQPFYIERVLSFKGALNRSDRASPPSFEEQPRCRQWLAR